MLYDCWKFQPLKCMQWFAGRLLDTLHRVAGEEEASEEYEKNGFCT